MSTSHPPVHAVNRYKADLRELHFLLFEQFKLGDVLGQPPYEGWGEDEVKSALAECYRFSTQVLGPLNPVGDVEGCRVEGGARSRRRPASPRPGASSPRRAGSRCPRRASWEAPTRRARCRR
jgi:hypothetical protein